MGKDHSNYYYVKFTAYAELDGEKVDIAGVETTYALNKIPTVVVRPTLGRDPSNDKEAGAVSKFLKAKQYTSLKVYAKFETELDSPDGNADPGFPYNKDVLLFDGYVMGLDYVTSRSPVGGGMQLRCNGSGWLTGLAGTDAQLVGTTAKGPAGYDELANPSSDDAGVGLLDMQALIIDAEGALIDLWAYIKDVFEAIVNNKSVWGDTENKSAQAALARLDAAPFGGDVTNVLNLDFGGSADSKELLTEFLAQAVSRVIFTAWRGGGTSLWNVLTSLAQEFRFSIVPLIETAACCPVYGALGGKPYKTLTTNDYSAINLKSEVQMMVTKFALIGGQDSYSVTRSSTPREGGLIGLGDIRDAIENEYDKVTGQTLIAQVPMWLAAESEIGTITRDSLGGEKFGMPDASNPTAFTGAPEQDYQQLYNDIRNSQLANNYAKAVLQEMNLANRVGGLGGRFRLDICPGSTIRFEVIDDKFADPAAEPQYMFALVDSVTIMLESGGSGPLGSAITSFGLKYIRTAEEHDKTYLTSDSHPLWGKPNAFIGTRLWKE